MYPIYVLDKEFWGQIYLSWTNDLWMQLSNFIQGIMYAQAVGWKFMNWLQIIKSKICAAVLIGIENQQKIKYLISLKIEAVHCKQFSLSMSIKSWYLQLKIIMISSKNV